MLESEMGFHFKMSFFGVKYSIYCTLRNDKERAYLVSAHPLSDRYALSYTWLFFNVNKRGDIIGDIYSNKIEGIEPVHVSNGKEIEKITNDISERIKLHLMADGL